MIHLYSLMLLFEKDMRYFFVPGVVVDIVVGIFVVVVSVGGLVVDGCS